MKTTVDESICVFGSDVILRHTAALRAEIAGVREAKDIEYIHRMRVASRRLRTALPLFSKCLPAKKLANWQKEIRAITKALGAARDTDVQLELLESVYRGAPLPQQRPGLQRLALRQYQRRSRLQANVLTALDSLEASQALDQLETAVAGYAARQDQVYIYTPALYQLAHQSIETSLDQFLAYSAIVSQPEEVEKLHAMRIAAKHLRYSMETFAPLYPDELKRFIGVLRKAQDSLGDIHDCDVWTMFLPQFRQKEMERVFQYFGTRAPFRELEPGLEYFAENRRALRFDIYTNFVTDWINWQEKGVWEELREQINRPLFLPQRVSPVPRPQPQPAPEVDTATPEVAAPAAEADTTAPEGDPAA